jgi:GDPmannose 4,6-dehydratase
MLQQDKPDDYVLATGRSHTIRRLAEVAFALVGLDYEAYVSQSADLIRPADVDLLIGDPSKAKTRLGWTATTSFEELVRLMVEAELAAIDRQ